MLYIVQVVVGCCDLLVIFGNDYLIEDGIGVCDYIYVMDLVDGYVVVMEKLVNKLGVYIYNFGVGVGNSVLDVVNVFSKVCGKLVNYYFVLCCEGDFLVYWVDVSKVDCELNWCVMCIFDEMVQDIWYWQLCYLQGYFD